MAKPWETADEDEEEEKIKFPATCEKLLKTRLRSVFGLAKVRSHTFVMQTVQAAIYINIVLQHRSSSLLTHKKIAVLHATHPRKRRQLHRSRGAAERLREASEILRVKCSRAQALAEEKRKGKAVAVEGVDLVFGREKLWPEE